MKYKILNFLEPKIQLLSPINLKFFKDKRK